MYDIFQILDLADSIHLFIEVMPKKNLIKWKTF